MNTRKLFLLLALLLLSGGASLAGETRYEMRVDGLVCPYCAYGVEKKLMALQGVMEIDVDLHNGLVVVVTADTVRFTDMQLTKLFNDAGFTFRSFRQIVPNADTGS